MDNTSSNTGDAAASSPTRIIMQTHAYMSPPPAASTPGDDDAQEEVEVNQPSGDNELVLFEPLDGVDDSEPVITAANTTDSADTDNIPAIEQSGTSTTEGTATTQDYSTPSSPTSPATPSRACSTGKADNINGVGQRPAATPAGPAQRTRRDNTLSMLYTPVKGGGDTNASERVADISTDNDDFLENEAGHQRRRKLPCNWMAWAALVAVITGALVITTGVVVHSKKKAAAAPSTLAGVSNSSMNGIGSEPTFIPSAKATGAPTDTIIPSEPALLDPLAGDGAETNNVDTIAISSKPIDESAAGATAVMNIDNANKEEAVDATGITTAPTSVTAGSDSVDAPTLSPAASPTSLTISEAEENTSAVIKGTANVTSVTKITYRPGDLTVSMNGLLLSSGLKAEIIAKSGKPVMYSDGKTSDTDFHKAPDFAGTFSAPNGGWIYASNSEVEDGKGGVGAITFDKKGRVTHYQKLLKGSTMNCGGGKTPWGTWISCEEFNLKGQIWEVDPTGRQSPKKTVLGGDGGRFESFSYDVRNEEAPHFYVTEDKFNGALRRFTPDPSVVDWNDPRKMLHGEGTMEYLVLIPYKGENATNKEGDFTWTKHIKVGRESAMELFPNVEGIDVAGNELFFVSKRLQEMTILDLDTNKYRTTSTVRGLFDGKPDQIQRITRGEGLLYFTEEGGVDAGVHARDSDGNFYTVLESPVWKDETTGLSFSPDAEHLYVAYQANGLLFDVTREDGLPFNGRSINAKFHSTEVNDNGGE
eukprot:CAMPEP_0178677438 /NCGR_PEP_ID=MMETSP0698-20121128/36445_1 /TAXON_ID=265572 /ORGANISM="Extubocellulus spinifer, Strain CCMP396" /LENGTH=758 /DNA_ID=CAMNT_0020321735 /DNA_START=146 /DNA_END=2423 /DNA_ORIENTATION=+